jgi:hypothetical protein
MVYARDAQPGELVPITCDGEGCPYNLHGKVVGGVTGPAVTTTALQDARAAIDEAMRAAGEREAQHFFGATVPSQLAPSLGISSDGKLASDRPAPEGECKAMRAGKQCKLANGHDGPHFRGRPSDLDAFRGMLERAGIRFEQRPAADPDAAGERTEIVAAGYNQNYVVYLYFDASGALKRVDGGV